MLRGKYDEAVALLEADAQCVMEPGWIAARGHLAAAYNALGEHARAKRVCDDALSRLGVADLEYVILNLPVQVEDVLADVELGAASDADARLA